MRRPTTGCRQIGMALHAPLRGAARPRQLLNPNVVRALIAGLGSFRWVSLAEDHAASCQPKVPRLRVEFASADS